MGLPLPIFIAVSFSKPIAVVSLAISAVLLFVCTTPVLVVEETVDENSKSEPRFELVGSDAVVTFSISGHANGYIHESQYY